MNCKFLLQFWKVLTVGCTSENINKVYVPIIRQGEFKNITVSLQMENLWNISTLKPWYIVNKTQLPFWGFTKHITFDIVNYSILWLVNKKGLTDLFAIWQQVCLFWINFRSLWNINKERNILNCWLALMANFFILHS